MNRKLCELNNLAAVHPDIAAEWDDVLNPEPGPEARFPGSPKKVMWKCLSGRDHPSYPQRIGTRTRFRLGCPIEAKEQKEQDRLARRAERERDQRDLAALYRQALEAAGKRDPFEDADVAWREANIGALVTREALDRRSTPPSRDASSTRASGQS